MGSEERQQELFSGAGDETDTSSTPSSNPSSQSASPTEQEALGESTQDLKSVKEHKESASREFETIPLKDSVVYVIDSYALIYQLFFAQIVFNRSLV